MYITLKVPHNCKAEILHTDSVNVSYERIEHFPFLLYLLQNFYSEAWGMLDIQSSWMQDLFNRPVISHLTIRLVRTHRLVLFLNSF